MPDREVTIGGRSFEVACEPGEEPYLDAAVALLNAEADALTRQIGRLTESRMLLMAGLMLADKAAGMEEKLTSLEAEAGQLRDELAKQRETAPPAAPAEPERVEVPVIPERVLDAFDALAERAERLAHETETRQPE